MYKEATIWHLETRSNERYCSSKGNNMPETAVEGLRKSMEGRSEHQRAICWKNTFTEKGTYKIFPGSTALESFTLTVGQKSMGLWGHQTDPWCLSAWSCADRTQISTAAAARSPGPSKSPGWRSLRSHWRRRNLSRWPNQSPESVS